MLYRLLFSIFMLVVFVQAEYYSSVDKMEQLGEVERQLVQNTRVYLEEQQQQLDKYRRFVANVKREHERAIEDLDNYVGHPLLAYLQIKRLVKDWDFMHDIIITNKPGEDFRSKVDKLVAELGYPNHAELGGAVRGLSRLQDVYNLSTGDLADGYFNNESFGSELSWHDCFEIAVQLQEQHQYKASLEWFSVSAVLLEQLPEEKQLIKDKFTIELHEYMAMANYELGNTERALELLDKILNYNPEHPARYTRSYFESSDKPKALVEQPRPEYYNNYTSLCQGRRLAEPTAKRLSCNLDFRRHAVFTLAPLKVEQAHIDPDINVYHDMLNDAQIDKILIESDEFEMFRSMVAGNDGKGTVAEFRVSQQTWLNYSSPVMQHVHRLVEQVSGFDMTGVEQMQLANYGVGGQYEPHADYFEINLSPEFDGDRISTSMFYLSDVIKGGYTIFTKLNVFLPPIKGAMVMWHNLHRSVDVDPRTQHAGCPVIIGSKRIGNIWVHSGPQMFRRPCDLSNDQPKSVGY